MMDCVCCRAYSAAASSMRGVCLCQTLLRAPCSDDDGPGGRCAGQVMVWVIAGSERGDKLGGI